MYVLKTSRIAQRPLLSINKNIIKKKTKSNHNKKKKRSVTVLLLQIIIIILSILLIFLLSFRQLSWETGLPDEFSLLRPTGSWCLFVSRTEQKYQYLSCFFDEIGCCLNQLSQDLHRGF